MADFMTARPAGVALQRNFAAEFQGNRSEPPKGYADEIACVNKQLTSPQTRRKSRKNTEFFPEASARRDLLKGTGATSTPGSADSLEDRLGRD